MAHMILASPALSDAAVLSSTADVAATLPLANLQVQQPGQAARFTALGSVWFDADLGAASAVDTIALLANNGTAAATWRIRAAATQGGLTAAPGYDSGAISLWPAAGRPTLWARPHALLWLSAAETWRWWRIDVFDAGNGDGFFEAGRLYLCAAWRPGRNLQYGASIGVVEDAANKEAAGGQIWPQLRGRRRRAEFSLKFLAEADMQRNALALDLARGQSGDVLFCQDPEADEFLNHTMLYGLMTGMRAIILDHFKLYSKSYRIEELVP